MPKLISGEYRICESCDAPMRNLPYLTEIYMCKQCRGFRYRVPEGWEQLPTDDDDAIIYKQETSGE